MQRDHEHLRTTRYHEGNRLVLAAVYFIVAGLPFRARHPWPLWKHEDINGFYSFPERVHKSRLFTGQLNGGLCAASFLATRSWRPDPGSQILATTSRLTDSGYQILATRSWLPDLGYQIRDTGSWIPEPGYQIQDTSRARTWLPHPGCQILATRSWQAIPGFQILATRSELPGPGH